MKKIVFVGFLMFAVVELWAASMVYDFDTCQYKCPDGLHRTGVLNPLDSNACDPAFITYERTWMSLKQVATSASQASQRGVTKPSASSDAERALLKALDEAKTVDRAWSVALEAWRTAVTAELQRGALAQVRSAAKTPSERETLSFMLSALENPATEMERCRELGRGTALERKKAADRLALLLQNPNLADRLK